jgi:hypothetical protein
MHHPAGDLRNSAMNFRALLGSTDATAVPAKLINRLKSGNYARRAIGPDLCRPLQGEHWRLSSVSAKRPPLAPIYPLKPYAENGNGLVFAAGPI